MINESKKKKNQEREKGKSERAKMEGVGVMEGAEWEEEASTRTCVE